MELKPQSLHIPLERRERWGLRLLYACVAVVAVAVLVNPTFAVVFFASIQSLARRCCIFCSSPFQPLGSSVVIATTMIVRQGLWLFQPGAVDGSWVTTANRIMKRLAPFGKKGLVYGVSIALTIGGCAVTPPALEPANRVPVPLDRLAVVAEQTRPKGLVTETSPSSAAEGAVGGGLLGILMLPAEPLLAVVALPMIPLLAVAGAAGGSAAARDVAELAVANLVPFAHKADVQGQLRDKIVDVLRRKNTAQHVSPQPVVPTDPKPALTLQVGLREIGFTIASGKDKRPGYALFIKPQAKLLDAEGKTVTVLDEMRFELRSPAHSREVWLDREHSPFATALSTALDEAAERIVFEMFEVYYSKAPEEPSHYAAPTPYYTLAPVHPEPTRGWLPGIPNPTPLTGDLNPAFRWQSFPRGIDVATVDGQIGRFTDVQYDLRVFSVLKRKQTFGNNLRCFFSRGLDPDCDSGPPYILGPEVYRRDGLTEPEHRIEFPLTPCAFYAWTVRARFRLDGHFRATEWTGTYLFAPWKVRRGLLMPGEQNMQDRRIDWLLFRAPPPAEATVCAD